jgi:hypothetical protein
MPEATRAGITKVHLTDQDGVSVAGGSGGGPASIADGLDVAQGTTTDVAWVSGAGTVIALLKKIASSGASAGLTDAQLRATPVPVSGTFWQATQPTSVADGANVTLGAKADTAWDGVAASASEIAILKKLWSQTQLVYNVLNNSLGWTDASAYFSGLTGQMSFFVRRDTPTALSANGNLIPPITDSLGKLWVNTGGLTDTQLRAAAVPVSGTFWQATQPISAASLPLPTGASTEATLALLQVAGGTAIGTLKSQLASAVAATSAPSYTDGTINPLSQTLAGALRVGGTVTATGPLTDTQLRASAVPVSGTFFQATQPVSIAAAVDVSDRAARLLGVVDKGKIWDGTNIATVKAGVIAVAGDNPLVVTVHPSSAPTTAQSVTGTFWQATQPVSGTVTANQGTANTAANGWFTRLTDGTSNVAVKAASTAAAAADPALVVALSPNSEVTPADGLANTVALPTADQALLWNGATWDRSHNNWKTTTGDSGAKTATFNGATQTNYDAVGALITVILGVVSGTTPTLSIAPSWSPDGGTTWFFFNNGAGTTNLTVSSTNGLIVIAPIVMAANVYGTAGNAAAQLLVPAYLPRTWRLAYTIAGTTPSFTISSVQVQYIKG